MVPGLFRPVLNDLGLCVCGFGGVGVNQITLYSYVDYTLISLYKKPPITRTFRTIASRTGLYYI